MMATGFAGHNRGKKWVPGVGYRYPPRPKKPPPRCDCGRKACCFVARPGREPAKALCQVCSEAADAVAGKAALIAPDWQNG